MFYKEFFFSFYDFIKTHLALKLVEKKQELHDTETRNKEVKLDYQTAETELQNVKQQQHEELVRGAIELDRMSREKESGSQKVLEEERNVKELQDTYNKMKLLLSRKASATSKRQNNPTSKELLSTGSTTK